MSQNTEEFARGPAAGIIKPLSNNFVERPWGGTRIRELKGLCPLPEQLAIGGAGLGESFEIAAFDDDEEARLHPSRVPLADGSVVTLASLLRSQGDTLLGARWLRMHGPCIPLLPKILDIRELLSVQGHPPGHTEAYVIIAAEPGATIRLGFRTPMERGALRRELVTGRQAQLELIELLRRDASPALLHKTLGRWFADRGATVEAVLSAIGPMLSSRDALAACVASLERLKQGYWRMLDAMNEIPVVPGQIIHNANPARCLRRLGRAPAAEVHALGNPAGREIVALEIRKPGPTLRAWDHARFPLRDIDIDGALEVLNLDATDPSEFVVEPVPVPGAAHTAVSVDGEYFRLHHLTPPSGSSVAVSDDVHCLHNLAGRVELERFDGCGLGHLERGESAVVPAPVDAYRLTARDADAHVVKVSLR